MKLLSVLLAIASFVTPASAGELLQPKFSRKIDARTHGVAWLDADHVVLASPQGVTALDLATGTSSQMIAPHAAPYGVPDPVSVATDGRSVVASNGWDRTQYACRASDRARLFARMGPFMVNDIAVKDDKLYVLGWPIGPNGANNPKGIAVWKGEISAYFDKLAPLHQIESSGEAISIFNNTQPMYGGSLAVEANGDVDIVTPAEPGVYQYSADGKLRHHLGAGLDELVVNRMHDINYLYAIDQAGRYREIINRQPFADDVIATPDGPAIVVRLSRNDRIEWELWYPNAERVERRVKLGISRPGPYGHISCDARGRDLACVYSLPDSAAAATNPDQRTVPAYLVRFELPSHRATTVAAVTHK